MFDLTQQKVDGEDKGESGYIFAWMVAFCGLEQGQHT